LTFTLLINLIVAQILLNSISVRIHSKIARHPWARLWYLFRAFDVDGLGHSQLPVVLVLELLGIKESTLYRYMKRGSDVGAFRRIKINNGTIDAWIGSLNVVCKKLQLSDWGTVGEVPLVKSSRKFAGTPPG